MANTPKRPKAKRIKRNPVAKVLRTVKFRPRVASKPGIYRRRVKFRVDEDDAT